MTQEDVMIEYVWYALYPKEYSKSKSQGPVMYIKDSFYCGDTKICRNEKHEDDYIFELLDYRDKISCPTTSIRRNAKKLDNIIRDIAKRYKFTISINYLSQHEV